MDDKIKMSYKKYRFFYCTQCHCFVGRLTDKEWKDRYEKICDDCNDHLIRRSNDPRPWGN